MFSDRQPIGSKLAQWEGEAAQLNFYISQSILTAPKTYFRCIVVIPTSIDSNFNFQNCFHNYFPMDYSSNHVKQVGCYFTDKNTEICLCKVVTTSEPHSYNWQNCN